MENWQELLESGGGKPPHGGAREQLEGMERVQNLEAVINEGLRVALLEDTPDQSLEVLLEYLGNALNGERTYIFERNKDGRDDNTYEWVAGGVRPEKENLQNLPPEVCANWYRNFSVGRHIVIEDLNDIRQSDPIQYENLKRQNISSLVVVPLYDNDEILGFYGVDNPPLKTLEYVSDMLQIMAHFIVSSLRQRNLVRKLHERSYEVLHVLNVDYVGIYAVDFDTDKCQVYREKERLKDGCGIDFEESYQTAMGRYISACVEPRDQKRLRAMTERSRVLAQLRTKKKFYIRYRVKDDPKGINNMELHFCRTETDAGKNNVIFAFRDIDAVVEQEERYRLEARRDIENVLEGARTGIWTIELEDDCAPRMYADQTMRMLLGVGEDIGPEECYQSWFRNIDPEYVDTVREAVREMLETGRSEVVYPWNHPALGKIYVRCGGVPDKKFDKPGSCLRGYHQDITETMVTRKKQDQAMLELLEKVRQANSAKSEFLSHMSHDLRTPINGIQGMLTVMEKCLDDPEKQRACREKIRISADHLLSLVNDVLEISKLESGRFTDVKVSFDLRELVEDCAAILAPKAEETGIHLEPPEVELRHSGLIGNPLYVKRVLTNILDNAVKYNRPNGYVFIRVKEMFFKDGVAGYQFTVEDTGIGIGMEFQKRIYEPFTQENQDARTDYKGTGLGMSIAKKLIDRMNGTIELDSRIGEGTVFRVALPLQVDAKGPRPAARKEDAPADISGMRVLLVEDNEINCEIMQFVLEEAGASVTAAQNGQIAVQTFAASDPGTFDCVLMDLMMPVMSGLEAARVIRGMDRPDAQTVPIIALSANAFEEDVAMAKEAGMNEHLAKPVNINKLVQTMRRFKNLPS